MFAGIHPITFHVPDLNYGMDLLVGSCLWGEFVGTLGGPHGGEAFGLFGPCPFLLWMSGGLGYNMLGLRWLPVWGLALLGSLYEVGRRAT